MVATAPRRHLRTTTLALSLTLVLAACGSSGGSAGVSTYAGPYVDLGLTLFPDGTDDVSHATQQRIQCGIDGSLLQGATTAAALCRRLATINGLKVLRHPVPKTAVCAEIFGGPTVVHLTGVAAGQAVDEEFTRVNSCETARFDTLLKGVVPPWQPIRPATGTTTTP